MGNIIIYHQTSYHILGQIRMMFLPISCRSGLYHSHPWYSHFFCLGHNMAYTFYHQIVLTNPWLGMGFAVDRVAYPLVNEGFNAWLATSNRGARCTSFHLKHHLWAARLWFRINWKHVEAAHLLESMIDPIRAPLNAAADWLLGLPCSHRCAVTAQCPCSNAYHRAVGAVDRCHKDRPCCWLLWLSCCGFSCDCHYHADPWRVRRKLATQGVQKLASPQMAELGDLILSQTRIEPNQPVDQLVEQRLYSWLAWTSPIVSGCTHLPNPFFWRGRSVNLLERKKLQQEKQTIVNLLFWEMVFTNH